jgi:hypothetical protein
MSNKETLLEQANALRVKLSHALPGFTVVDRTFAEFEKNIRDMPEAEFVGEAHEALYRVRQLLSRRQADDARLAEAYIDIWHCTNFASATWRGLVLANADRIGLAIEHACLVISLSGADGAVELAKLISETDCIAVARPHLERVARKDDWWARWVTHVLTYAMGSGRYSMRM